MKRSIYSLSSANKFKSTNLFEIKEHFRNLLQNGEIKSIVCNDILKRLDKVEILDWHQSIATRQRNKYNNMKEKLPEDYIFIEIDFKQKIVIGMSPRQIGKEYYNQQQRTVLGFGLYYRENGKVNCINLDIISDILDQTCYFVISAFR